MGLITQEIIRRDLLLEEIVAVDCGAAGSNIRQLFNDCSSRLRVIGFDFDAAECERLNRLSPYPRDLYLPVCIGDGNEHQFNVYQRRDASSFFVPTNDSILRRVGFVDVYNQNQLRVLQDEWQIDRQIIVQTRTLKSLIDAGEIPKIDYLKMDVEGAELMIAQSLGEHAQTLLGVESEVIFSPMRANCPLFADIDIELRKSDLTFFGFYFTHAGH